MKKLLISLISFALFFLILWGVESHSSIISLIDLKMSSFTVYARNPFLDKIMVGATNAGGPVGAAIIFAIFSFIIILKKGRDYLYVFAISFVLSVLSESIIKILVARARPASQYLIKETGFSFPSGHAIAATVFLISALFMIGPAIKNKLYKIIFLAVSCVFFPVVALSRIYLSVHFTSDVLASIFLGTAIFIAVDIITMKLLRGDGKNVINES